MNLREAIREAKDLGVPMRQIEGTGEILFLFEGQWSRVNSRRKDAPRKLMVLLRRERERQSHSGLRSTSR